MALHYSMSNTLLQYGTLWFFFQCSEPQLWDFVNDPVGLKGPDGVAAPEKGNVEVLFFDFVVPSCSSCFPSKQVQLKTSKRKNGLIFKATFTEDAPQGTECFIKYGYNPSWDSVKNGSLTCVAQSVEQEAPEEKQREAEAEAPEAAKPKKNKDKRRNKDNPTQVPGVASQDD